jgi:hypothetical protein
MTNTFNPAYEADNSVTSGSNSGEIKFSTSTYLYGVHLLEGHKKIEKGALPKFNLTTEDHSRLAALLKEHNLNIN